MSGKRQLHLCGEYITYSDRKHAVGFYYVVNGQTGVHIYAKNKRIEATIREQFRELSKRIPVDTDCDYEWKCLLSDFKNALGQIQIQPLEDGSEWLDKIRNGEGPNRTGGEIHPSLTEYIPAACVGPQLQD